MHLGHSSPGPSTTEGDSLLRLRPLLCLLGALQLVSLAAAVVPGVRSALVVVAAGTGSLLALALILVRLRAWWNAVVEERDLALRQAEHVAPLASWSYDLRQRRMHWSETLYKMLGWDGDEVLPTVVHGLHAIHADDRRWVHGVFKNVVETHQSADVCARVCRPNGETRVLRTHVEVQRDWRHQPVRLTGVCLDLTEEMHQVSEMVSTMEEAIGMQRFKEVFLTNMSHEIRTPLTGILGFTEILLEEVDESHREFLQAIERNGHRLLDTLTSILDLAQLEERAAEFEPEEVLAAREVEARMRDYAKQASDKGIALRVQVQAPTARICVDRPHLHRVLGHLIGNAVKFTDAGSVTVEVDADAAHVYLRVRDTGIGISPEFLPHLFDAFRQESDGLDRSHEGSGLGLAVTKRIVELMGGRITVDSEKGAGSTFTLVFSRTFTRTAKPEPQSPSTASPLTLVGPPKAAGWALPDSGDGTRSDAVPQVRPAAHSG